MNVISAMPLASATTSQSDWKNDAGCSKLGGLAAQGLSVLAIAPPLGAAAAAVGALAVVSLGLISVLGRETRGRDLRDLEDR